MSPIRDTIVFGGGPAGCATALRLRQQGASVTLVERSHYQHPRAGESLAPVALGLLNQLGVRDRFDAENFQATTGLLFSWGSPDLAFSSFLAQPFGSGWNLDRARFDQMLSNACDANGVQVIQSRDRIRIHLEAGKWRVSIGEYDWTASSVVDATGKTSKLASQLGVQRVTHDRLIALVRYDDARNGDDPRLIIESSPDGWWYSAGLPGDHSVTAFLTDVDLVPKNVACRTDFFRQRLDQTRYAHRGSSLPSRSTKIRLVRANTSVLITPSRANWYAVGDAALSIDPLSGSGMIRALNTGIAAANAIASTKNGVWRLYNDFITDVWQEAKTQALDTYSRESRWTTPFWRRRNPTNTTARDNLLNDTVAFSDSHL